MNRILFSKTGMAKYISHLDLMRTMQRALLRAGLEIKHTQGFNPHPHMVFALPLPVGCESCCELMDFELVKDAGEEEIVSGMNRTLPEGIEVISAYVPERKLKEIAKLEMEIIFTFDSGATEEKADRLRELFERNEIVVNKKTKKGFSDINIRELMDKVEISIYNSSKIRLSAVIAAQNPSLNPLLITTAIGNYEPELAPDQVSYNRKEIYDNEMNIFR
ncbi:MAG: DUF2344 domain-containing protein [Oscillospiraceae bacterium]|nr:DUF2344 domain-containing protein [Oscillospiraceae bacterium]